jgi:hypothetical protein
MHRSLSEENQQAQAQLMSGVEGRRSPWRNKF